jgi:16S rRNA A1518/A1519 N6-dimethyltransferase RsmA/KsgA/DIM1 with predicted DNA glycosylase/AP lyase activity
VKNNLERFVHTLIKGQPGAAEISALALSACGIPPDKRAENLPLDDFAALAAYLEKEVSHVHP